MKKRLFIIAVTVAMLTVSAHAQKLTTNRDIEPQCLGVRHDGSQTLRVSGFGKSTDMALEQAYKNAVYAVLFNGITSGGECDQRPLVPEVNARKRYKDYFDTFFMDNGPYREFISDEDERLYGREEAKNSYGRRIIVVVRVLKSQLKARLKQDGILK